MNRLWQRIRLRVLQILHTHRMQLTSSEAVLQLAVLGIVSGLLTGLVIIAFRLAIEYSQTLFLPAADPENYESLTPLVRFIIPIIGALIIAAAYHWIRNLCDRQVGIVHVLERLSMHQGIMPLANLALQFIGGAVSIISGHSVGREGPSVHLGSGSASVMGKLLNLPNNSIRILVACGTAAAVGASFNTPLAGVVFAMEVVIMEYSVAGFMPVILAAISATTLSRLVFGSDPAFVIPTPALPAITELPYTLLLGFVCGCLAAVFIMLLLRFSKLLSDRSMGWRLLLAGVVTGLCALVAPQIMGIGYDTVNGVLLGQIAPAALILILFVKLIATSAAIGLGIPGGLIGPTLLMGALLGGIVGSLEPGLAGASSAYTAFYGLLGMGAMMGATLQAPLAALTALLEMSETPTIILHGMIAIVAANITSSEVFRRKSVFLELLRARGMDYHNDPIARSLQQTSVAQVMQRDIAILPIHVSRAQATKALSEKPRWIVVSNELRTVFALPAHFLLHNLETETEDTVIHLGEIPAQRVDVAPINLHSSLQEAQQCFDYLNVEMLYVQRQNAPGIQHIYGVVTREDIESSY